MCIRDSLRTIYFSLYHVLIFIGIFQGLLLAYIFLFNKRFRKKSNFAFAISVLTIVFAGMAEIAIDLNLHEQYVLFPSLLLANFSLIGIGYYYFVLFLIQPHYQFKKKDYWIITPFIVEFLSRLIVYGNQVIQPTIIEDSPSLFRPFSLFINYLPICYMAIVCYWVYRELRKYHHKLLDNFSEIQGKELYWLESLNYFFVLFTVYWFFVITILFVGERFLFLRDSIWIIGCMLVYWLAYIVMLKREIFAIPIFEEPTDKIEKNNLSDKTEEHYQKLLQLLTTEKLYQDTDLNMDMLSQKMNLSNGYLSKIINQKEGKNFYEFINTYRIEEVKAHLSHPDYAHYSILGIGLEAGFKSKSTFNAVFKKMTGMTPSAYKRQLAP